MSDVMKSWEEYDIEMQIAEEQMKKELEAEFAWMDALEYEIDMQMERAFGLTAEEKRARRKEKYVN